ALIVLLPSGGRLFESGLDRLVLFRIYLNRRFFLEVSQRRLNALKRSWIFLLDRVVFQKRLNLFQRRNAASLGLYQLDNKEMGLLRYCCRRWRRSPCRNLGLNDLFRVFTRLEFLDGFEYRGRQVGIGDKP